VLATEVFSRRHGAVRLTLFLSIRDDLIGKTRKIRSLVFIGGLERNAKRRKIQHAEAVGSRGRCRSAILPGGDDKLECARRPSQRPVRKPLSVIAIIDRAGDLDRRVQADVLIKVGGVETTAARSTKRPARRKKPPRRRLS
jgi:hypothetical protein